MVIMMVQGSWEWAMKVQDCIKPKMEVFFLILAIYGTDDNTEYM